jgi:hypothetical protein
MESIFSKMFLDITARIQTEVPEIKWIDQDFGQLENYGDRPSVLFPCLLLDFEDMTFSNKGERTQIGEGSVLFRLGFQPWSNTNSATPEVYRKKAMHYYELEHKLHQCLQGYGTEEFGPLIRTSAGTEERNDNLRVRQIRYSVVSDDDSVLPETSPIPEDTEPMITLKLR